MHIERRPGVLPLAASERRHAVGDRLDAGHRRAARGERVQHEDRAAPHRRARAGVPTAPCRRVAVGVRQVAATPAGTRPDAEQDDHVDDEEVRRDGEDPARLLDARAGCPHAMSDDEERPTIGTRYGSSAGDRRREGGGPGRDRDRDREDVVGEQRDAGDLRGQEPEVVLGDDVGAAGASGRP